MRPIGLAFDNVKCVQVTVEMMEVVGGQAHRVIPVHEARLPTVFPSREGRNGLSVTEIVLGDGTRSQIP